LLAIYRRAHRQKDPQILDELKFTKVLLDKWAKPEPDAPPKGIIRELFELPLQDIRVIENPKPDVDSITYYWRKSPDEDCADGTGVSLSGRELYGKLVLVVERPGGGGERVEVDPGFAVCRDWGRFWLEIAVGPLVENAVAAVRSGRKTPYRAFPLGLDNQAGLQFWKETQDRVNRYQSWRLVEQKLDELEEQIAKRDGKGAR
jgi:hypothetical protein